VVEETASNVMKVDTWQETAQILKVEVRLPCPNSDSRGKTVLILIVDVSYVYSSLCPIYDSRCKSTLS
jgi:hypothetical protein